MEPGLLATAREFISGYWPHVSVGAVAAAATVGTAIFAYIRRPKSPPTEAGPYFTDAALLSPPLTRPAYSDRMAYVLAEMSDLAYYQFEGRRGFVDDAVENAMSLDLTDDTNVREFLETFSTELMSGRRLQLGSMKKVLSNSGFSLLDVIDIRETQGFACKRIVENEPPYVVLAFRGTEKKISDWLTDARCVPTVEGKSKVHSGFLEVFAVKEDADGKTVKDAVEDILARVGPRGLCDSIRQSGGTCLIESQNGKSSSKSSSATGLLSSGRSPTKASRCGSMRATPARAMRMRSSRRSSSSARPMCGASTVTSRAAASRVGTARFSR